MPDGFGKRSVVAVAAALLSAAAFAAGDVRAGGSVGALYVDVGVPVGAGYVEVGGYRRHYRAPRHRYRYAPPRRFHRRRHEHGDDAAFFLGGLLLGAILYESSRDTTVIREPPRRAIVRERVVERYPDSWTRLWRDADGNCYELRAFDDGSELRTPVAPSECDW